MYKSNIFESQPLTDFNKFGCFYNTLSMPSEYAWQVMRQNKISLPYYIDETQIYYTDSSLFNEQFFRSITDDDSPSKTFLSKKVGDGPKIIGNLLYRGFAFTLNQKGFANLGLTADSLYFLPDDPNYNLLIKRSEADYRIRRGFGPKIHVSSRPNSVLLILETRARREVIVQPQQWKDWVGYIVAISSEKRKVDTQLDALPKGDWRLEELSPLGIATIKQSGYQSIVATDSIYVPGSPNAIRRSMAFDSISAFERFDDIGTSAILDAFGFLIMAYGNILNNNQLTIKMDSTGEIQLVFEQIPFDEVRPSGTSEDN